MVDPRSLWPASILEGHLNTLPRGIHVEEYSLGDVGCVRPHPSWGLDINGKRVRLSCSRREVSLGWPRGSECWGCVDSSHNGERRSRWLPVSSGSFGILGTAGSAGGRLPRMRPRGDWDLVLLLLGLC